ncbi:MAG: hypothetical protein KF901_06560 [Myxococcales bacterium]|nr:hypothetical protein [Myxococcales bacterium]
MTRPRGLRRWARLVALAAVIGAASPRASMAQTGETSEIGGDDATPPLGAPTRDSTGERDPAASLGSTEASAEGSAPTAASSPEHDPAASLGSTVASAEGSSAGDPAAPLGSTGPTEGAEEEELPVIPPPPTSDGPVPVPLPLARPVPLPLPTGAGGGAPRWRPRAQLSLRGAALRNVEGEGGLVMGLLSARVWFGDVESALQWTVEVEVGPLWAAPREGIGQSTFGLRLGLEIGDESRLGLELYARRTGRAFSPTEVGSHHIVGLATSLQLERGGMRVQIGLGPTSHFGFGFVAALTSRLALVFETETLFGIAPIAINASRTELGVRAQLTSPDSPKLKVSVDLGVSRGRVAFYPHCELVACPEELRSAAGFGGFVGLVIERQRHTRSATPRSLARVVEREAW